MLRILHVQQHPWCDRVKFYLLTWYKTAYKTVFEVTDSEKSLLNITNSRGPNIELWDTPWFIAKELDFCPLNFTSWRLFSKYDLINLQLVG